MVSIPQHFRFGEQRVMAILAALVGFCFLIRGFTKTWCRILALGLSALDPQLPEEVTTASSLSTTGVVSRNRFVKASKWI